jgi:multicomponent Na+:H+ antiporter subunit D
MGDQLPVFQIVLPLIAAPVVALIGQRLVAWVVTCVVSWALLANSVVMLGEVRRTGELVYALGGWAAPWGIEYRVDPTNAFVILIVSMIAAIVFPYAPRSLSREVADDRQQYICAMLLLCMCGLMGIAITGDAFNVFVFLEISSLSGYALIAMGPNRRALTSAYQYLVMGTIGGTFILLGVGLMYMMTGTLNMADLARRLPEVSDTTTVRAALAFLTVGASIKLALFPLHSWLPGAYTYAPTAVSAFISATATKVSYYVLVRVICTFFGAALVFETMHLDRALMVFSLLAIYAASTAAIFQSNVKRLLAYSSVAQIGYMVLGLSYATVTGLSAGLVHLFNHALTKAGLFMAVGCVAYRLGSARLEEMRGIGKRMPLTMLAFVFGGLSLIGVPLTVGFVSKWALIQGALEIGLWPVAGAALLSSLLAVVYVWRVVECMFFGEPEGPAAQVQEAPLSMLLPTWIMIGGTVVFGIFTDATMGVARQAAARLMGVM